MKTKKPADLNDFELRRDEKRARFSTMAITAAIIISILSKIFFSKEYGLSPFSIMTLAFFPIMIININNWNALKKEIKARNLLGKN